MDTKVNYQYSYFIYPYLLKNIGYKEYISNLINNKKYKLKIFEKEKDLEIYEFFRAGIRKDYFPTFYINKNNYNREELLDNKCVIFEYLLENKNREEDTDKSLVFDIAKIELICFETGICFLAFKTQIVNGKLNLSDVLNFNYKMKDINSEFFKLKSYDNINLKNYYLEDLSKISMLIKEITMCTPKNKRFFTYSYTCVDIENWNDEADKLESDFLKYVNVYPNNYDMSFEEENIIMRMYNWKYVKLGFTSESMSLLTNNMEHSNYTKLPFEFENKYFYNLILNLYKKELLKNIENNNIKIKSLNNYKKLYDEIISNDYTDDNIGMEINNRLNKVFNINKKVNKVEKMCKKGFELKIVQKYKTVGTIVLTILIISLIFNIIGLLN